MKVLVTGARGQMGCDILRTLKERNIFCCGVDRQEFDLSDQPMMRQVLYAVCPQAVIHCGAYTAVDQAEDDAERCYAVNAIGTRNLAGICRELDAKMLYMSTDYVFSGDGSMPHETDDPTAPLSVYGRSKLMGEEAVRDALSRHYIVRSSWAFGVHGQNFVQKILGRAVSMSILPVVANQIGSPTFTEDIAQLVCDMIQTEKYGTYHVTNEGFCSWAEFAEATLRMAGSSSRVQPVLAGDFPARAPRPQNSRLSKKSLDVAGFSRLPTWEDSLARYLTQINR